MEPGTGASVRQRVSGGTARLSRNSSLALSPLSPSARVAEQVPPAAPVLICRCPKGAGAWENLGVLITLGVQPLCQAVSVWGLWGSLSGVLGWNQGLLGAGHGLSEVGAVSSPGLCLLSSFYFSFPSREAASAHQGVLMVAQGRVRHRNLLTHFWGKSPRLQSWSQTGKSN